MNYSSVTIVMSQYAYLFSAMYMTFTANISDSTGKQTVSTDHVSLLVIIRIT